MAKKISKKPATKSAKKPVPAKKAVKKAVKAKAAPKSKPKPAPKAAKAVKKLIKPVSKQKTAPKPVKKTILVKSKALTPVKPVKKEIVKVKTVPVKAIPAKEIKPVAPVAIAPKGKKAAVPVVTLPPPPSNLPKLPKGFVLKKQKGKLAPGEKRLFKTSVITHHIISEVALEENEKKGKPEPKGKFELEYIIHTPVTLLYDFLTTPNGLAEWFADGVDMKNDVYTFDWDGQKQNAKIVSAKIDSFIRLRWLDKPEGSYFEFRLNQDELTNEVSLIVTDFGDGEDDIATSRRLWNSQIQRLVKALGTY